MFSKISNAGLCNKVFLSSFCASSSFYKPEYNLSTDLMCGSRIKHIKCKYAPFKSEQTNVQGWKVTKYIYLSTVLMLPLQL